MPAAPTTLVLILGDQLTPDIAALRGCDPASTRVLLAEVAAETNYVGHYQAKIAYVLAAMRHFATELRSAGWQVDYVTLDDPGNSGTIVGEVERAVVRTGATRVRATEPGEWRLRDALAQADCGIELVEDERFLCDHVTFDTWANARASLRMEFFYREMRRATGWLMVDGQPAGGRWNYDAENRKPAPRDLLMPRPLSIVPDAVTSEVLAMVADRFANNFGSLDAFAFPVTRDAAERAFDHFVTTTLTRFGDFQDAMLRDEPYLYHAVIGLHLNSGLLDPRAVCERVDRAWREGHVPINAAEGFIRQILGWREYVRGIYWREGRDYTRRNALDATRPLPWFYWSGETEMTCVRSVVAQTRDHAYAHHIQRLMVTGNFALIAGIDPFEVHKWYLAVYADAYEWVEAPNTVGMSLYGDGGLLASKPYASSGAYIDRMSDYCGNCSYDVKAKTGPRACPFNYLYWDFLIRNRPKLVRNPRLGAMYATLARMLPEQVATIRANAATFLDAQVPARDVLAP